MRNIRCKDTRPWLVYLPCQGIIGSTRDYCAEHFLEDSVLTVCSMNSHSIGDKAIHDLQTLTRVASGIATEIVDYTDDIRCCFHTQFDCQGMPPDLQDRINRNYLKVVSHSALATLMTMSDEAAQNSGGWVYWKLAVKAARRVALEALSTRVFSQLIQSSISSYTFSEDSRGIELLGDSPQWQYKWGVQSDPILALLPVLYIDGLDSYGEFLTVVVPKQENFSASEYVALRVEGSWQAASMFARCIDGEIYDIILDGGDTA